MQVQASSFLNLHDADKTIRRLQIRLLQLILAFICLASLSFVVSTSIGDDGLISDVGLLSSLITFISAILFVIVSRGQSIATIGTFVIVYLTLISVFMYTTFDDPSLMAIFLTLTGITGAVIASRRAFQFLILIIFMQIIWLASQAVTVNDLGEVERSLTVSFITLALGLAPIIIGLSARYFVSQVIETATRAQQSVILLSASADIGRILSEVQDVKTLLDQAVEIIRERFNFYHVSIFLLDENEQYALLTASTGDVGKQMLARGHRLAVNTNSIVGRASQSNDFIMTRDAENDRGQAFNELLPLTRSELAIPIADNNGKIGVLDIQSQKTDAFDSAELDTLGVIANQLTTAIRNARLFEDRENSIRENKRLFIEAETNLREIQRLNRQLTKQAWADYLRTDRRIDGVTLSDNTFKNNAQWTDEMIDASRRRRAITEEQDGVRKVAVPIELRGEVVGAIELETSPDTKKDDLVDMVNTVSQRLAVSLDNARLFEESNEATAQEQRVSEIVSQYQTADSVEELLRVTVQGLAETLGADHASIRLGAVPNIADFDSDPKLPIAPANGGSDHDS